MIITIEFASNNETSIRKINNNQSKILFNIILILQYTKNTIFLKRKRYIILTKNFENINEKLNNTFIMKKNKMNEN